MLYKFQKLQISIFNARQFYNFIPFRTKNIVELLKHDPKKSFQSFHLQQLMLPAFLYHTARHCLVNKSLLLHEGFLSLGKEIFLFVIAQEIRTFHSD